MLRQPIESAQYAAKDYQRKLQARGITVSMSRKGDCWDNAPMESVNGTLKVECVNAEHFKTREKAHRFNLNNQGIVAMSSTALPTAGRFRFVASDRTGRPWITLFVLRGVHQTGSGSLLPCLK